VSWFFVEAVARPIAVQRPHSTFSQRIRSYLRLFFQVGSGADFLEVKEAKLGPNGELETQKNSPHGDLRLVI